ncbi:MAG: haloacid dehalogenase type II [Calditrichia bacterium]
MSTGKPLLGIKACVFDAYGTLFDVHAAITPYRAALGEKADAVSATWRQKQLEYTWLRSLMGTHADFWQVTSEALEFACSKHGILDQPLRQNLLNAYLALPCYPEVAATLKQLQQSIPCAILSNGSPKMLSSGVKSGGITDYLSDIISVEEIGIFKPHPSVYQLAVDRLRVTASEICFLSSNSWDVAGAASFGFQAIWINRFSQPWENLPQQPRAAIKSLDELLPLIIK